MHKESAALQQRCKQLSEAADKAGRASEKDASKANEVAELTKSCAALRAQVRVDAWHATRDTARHSLEKKAGMACRGALLVSAQS